MNNKRNMFSFTLAEVLITLTVIGVVASLTVPLLANNHKRTEYAMKLKKFYTNMNVTFEKAEADYGVTSDKWVWHSNGLDFFNSYLKEHVKYTKIETSSSNSAPFHGQSVSNTRPVIYLDDGTRFRIGQHSSYTDAKSGRTKSYKYFEFDVNGDAPPNEYCRDIFRFTFPQRGYIDVDGTAYSTHNEFGIWPTYYNYTRAELLELVRVGTSSRANSCTTLVKRDGWQFKKDSAPGANDGYPWRL